ncbi:hypothetical protein LINPERPRIM_LOCUS18494 [Linum perenne]
MALRLMKLGNMLIKQVTSPPSTRLSTRMERRFSNKASDVPIRSSDMEKEDPWPGSFFTRFLFYVVIAQLYYQVKIETEFKTCRKEILEEMAATTDHIEKALARQMQMLDEVDQLVTSRGLSDSDQSRSQGTRGM